MTEKRSATLCEDDIKDLVRETVKETLLSLGLETCEPLELQRDFAYLRDARTTSSSVRNKAVAGGLGLLLAGAGAALWEGLRVLLHRT